MFLGVFIGCLLYMLIFSKYFITINVKVVVTIKEIILKIISILILPIKMIINIINKIFFKPVRFITINLQKIKINSRKNIKKVIKSENKKVKV